MNPGPPPSPSGPSEPLGDLQPPRRKQSAGWLSWILAVVIVLILAVAGGLFTAWFVANLRAVPGPAAEASATPNSSVPGGLPSFGASPSAESSEAPRRTPTPEPTPELTPEPFVHIVAPGESLIYIAGLYKVTVDEIVELNDIQNPNRIQVGQELLIPGYGVPPTPKPPKTPKPAKTSKPRH